jgi:hypothetical protein
MVLLSHACVAGCVGCVLRTSHALFAAVLKESEMMVGCTPFSSSSWHFFRRAPQMTVTDVVPSPATTSCTRGFRLWFSHAWLTAVDCDWGCTAC